MVLLEVLRQLEAYQNIQRPKQKAAVTFPFFIGNMEESCPTTQAAEVARLEIQQYPFISYKSRNNFDPLHIRTVDGERYKHRVDLEDFWANAADEYDVRRRLWSRLPLSMIRATELFKIPDQLQDDGIYVQPGFNENEPLPPIRWFEPEMGDLATFMRPVFKYSQWWIDRQVEVLRQRNVQFTYELMGDTESCSSNAGASRGDGPTDAANSRKRKSINLQDKTRIK